MHCRLAIPLLLSIWCSLYAASPCRADAEKLQIDAGFPGGNIVVDKLDGDNVHLHQDLRDTAGDWFYWYFRVRGAQGRTLTFHFTKGNPLGVRGPAVSLDEGKTWKWLGAPAVRGSSFHFAFPADAREVRFCVAFPYQERNLKDFLARFEKNLHLKVETLCKTAKGREVELLRLGRLDGQAKQRVALTCRHHSCEMMASYVLEGLIEAVLADTDDGKWLREHVEFFIVPLVDKDGVEDGDQGKNRKPYDHNRDYAGDSIYASVKAIRERLPQWADGKLRFAMDMHCPANRGNGHETIYFVGGPNEAIWKEVGKFSKLLETTQQGSLVYSSKNNLPFGQGWNTQATYGNRKAFSRWAAELPGVRFASTLEVAYANADGKVVTDESARTLGRDLVRALRKYLAEE
ncbi:MAG: peptidase M14 [Planctomycetia bacterium]|nr:peptidase M14 [Planctomycetia bacterium]